MLDRTIHEGSKKFDSYVVKWGANKDAMKKLRTEGNQLVSKLNKRIRRIEKNGYTDIPSMSNYVMSNGKLRQFSIKGKTYNELQQVISEMKHFESMETSTITGIKKWLVNVHKATHSDKDLTKVDYTKISTETLYREGQRYFSIYHKLMEYGKSIEGGISPYLYYTEVFRKINESITDKKKPLSEMSDLEIDELTQNLQHEIDVLSNEQKVDKEAESDIKDFIWL